MRLACLGLILSLGGCAGVETAALSAGLAAAESGVTVLGRGKAQVYKSVTVEDGVEGVRRVAASLSLEPRGEFEKFDRTRLIYRDEQNDTIVVTVERKTATLALIHADVGLLGDVGLARYVLLHVEQELHRMNATTRPPVGEIPTP